MEIGNRLIATDRSKLVYFVKGDGGNGAALQRDRGHSGSRGLQGASGDKGSVESRGAAGKRGVEGPEGPPGKIGKLGHVGSKGEIGARGKRGGKGDSDGIRQQGPIGHRGCTGPRGVQCAKGLRGVAVIQGRRNKWNVVCVVYDTTSGKSSLWVNHGKICDFACCLPLKASTLNLFNRVNGLDGYIESVEMYNYYKFIPSGLIAARMTYLPERADGSTI